MMMDHVSWFVDAYVQRNKELLIVILAILIVRLFMKRMPKKYVYCLWAIVGIRMLVPLAISSPVSIYQFFPWTQAKAESHLIANESDLGWKQADAGERDLEQRQVDETYLVTEPYQEPASDGEDDAMLPLTFDDESLKEEELSAKELADAIFFGTWLIGMTAVLGIGLSSYGRVKRLVREAVLESGNLWECNGISTPFVLGIIHPRIYVPFHLDDERKPLALEHERQHVRRGDPLMRLLAYALLAAYWMNPLVWLSYLCLIRDQEMSCDEAVLRRLGEERKTDYGKTLLSFATDERFPGFTPVGFGESDAEKRIKNVLNYKKPGRWMIVAGITMVACLGIICLTAAKKKQSISPEPDHKMEAGTVVGKDAIPEEETRDHPVDDRETVKKDAQQVGTSATIFGLPVICEETWSNPENHTHYERKYYYKDVLVGKCSGYGESRDYVDDLDGDGITELICYTCETQTGNYDDVTVFRRIGNSIYMGRIVEYGLLEMKNLDVLSATGRISKHYDPDAHCLYLTYPVKGGSYANVTVTYDDVKFTEYSYVEPQVNSWKEAYANYVRRSECHTFSLIYLDDDEIPELLCQDYNDPQKIVSLQDGKIIERYLERDAFLYLEKKGIYYTTGGHMGEFPMEIVELRDGEFNLLAAGFQKSEYIVSAESTAPDQMTEFVNYDWNGQSVTEAEYNQRIDAIIDRKNAERPKALYTSDEMLTLLGMEISSLAVG